MYSIEKYFLKKSQSANPKRTSPQKFSKGLTETTTSIFYLVQSQKIVQPELTLVTYTVDVNFSLREYMLILTYAKLKLISKL